MKNKKIIVFILIFLVITLLGSIILLTKDKTEMVSKKLENSIGLDVMIEIAETDNIVNNEVQENLQNNDEGTITEEYKTDNIKEENPSSTNNKNQTVQAKSNNTKVVKTEQVSNNETTIKTQENTETKGQETVAVNKQEEPKQEENKTERVVTFKQNDAYIQKIRNYLTTHESEDMKQYGYTIKIDSSIVGQTTGFTYSELNMSGCTNTAGTIRIYARDYYLNGNYVETQCFVL